MEMINLFGVKIEKDDIAFAAILQEAADNIGKINEFVRQSTSKKAKKGDKRL